MATRDDRYSTARRVVLAAILAFASATLRASVHAATPELETALARARASSGYLVVVLVENDGTETTSAKDSLVGRWREAAHPHLQIVVSARSSPSVALRLGATTFPQLVVLDGDGREIGRIHGTPSPQALAARVRRLVDVASRLPEARAALERDPADAAALFCLGEYHWNRGQSHQAVQCFRGVVEASSRHADGAPSDPDLLARALCRLGESELDRGEAAAAEERFRAALSAAEAPRTRREAALGIAMSARRQGRLHEAIAVVENLVPETDEDGEDDRLRYTAGYLCLEAGDREEARRHFAACPQRHPDAAGAGHPDLRRWSGPPSGTSPRPPERSD